MESRLIEAEVVILGGGPAGLSAALSAARAGCSVTVVEAAEELGGQYFRQTPGALGAKRADRLHHDHRRGKQLIASARRLRSISVLTGARVWQAQIEGSGPRLRMLLGDGEERELSAGAVVLAPGAVERVLPFPGWDLPGVMTPGAAQALVKGSQVLPGRRVLVAGAGPFLLVVASLLVRLGVEVPAVLSATAHRQSMRLLGPMLLGAGSHHIPEALRYLATLARHRVPVKSGWAVIAARGEGAVEEAVITRLDGEWRPRPGSERTVAVDAVCCGFGFTPCLDLAIGLGCEVVLDDADGTPVLGVDEDGRTSVPAVFAAGEVTGIGGASLAIAEGALAGLAAAEYNGVSASTLAAGQRSRLRRRRTAEARFEGRLRSLTKPRGGWTSWASEETVVCRCEEVSLGELRAAIHDFGADDARSAKLLSRAGMGLCQARMCGANVAAIVAAETGTEASIDQLSARPIVEPIRLGTLAAQGLEDASEE